MQTDRHLLMIGTMAYVTGQYNDCYVNGTYVR